MMLPRSRHCKCGVCGKRIPCKGTRYFHRGNEDDKVRHCEICAASKRADALRRQLAELEAMMRQSA